MVDLQALAMIAEALRLLGERPDAPAIEALDRAMEGVDVTNICFDAVDQPFQQWTDPHSPFGELLRRAFAADRIGADAATLWLRSEDREDEPPLDIRFDWHEYVMEPFVYRYRLWGATASDPIPSDPHWQH